METKYQTAVRLYQAWEREVERYRINPDRIHDEQEAWDALIEHVEASGLNYSQWDPRRDEW